MVLPICNILFCVIPMGTYCFPSVARCANFHALLFRFENICFVIILSFLLLLSVPLPFAFHPCCVGVQDQLPAPSENLIIQFSLKGVMIKRPFWLFYCITSAICVHFR